MIRRFFKHISLVCRHRHKVLMHCAKCGILRRGIVHDLSKFSPTELFESVRFYQGDRSPISVCRRERGVSLAWLHHKGRNKHHIEYWIDDDCAEQPLMPYPYVVECLCDKIAATKVYSGNSYTIDMPLAHWLRYGNRARGNPRTMAFLETAFRDLAQHGEAYVLNPTYLKETYRKICLQESI